ncbi:cytochrome P450 [Nocardiopsis sp. MG754419]|nr:cytochrome P450 [Nocardiopsis sp. MG754419]
MPLHGEIDLPVPRLLEELRERFGSVAPVEVAPGVLAWVLLSYELNRTVLQDPHLFPRDPRRWVEAKDGRATPAEVPGPFWYFRNALSSDPPDHGRYREVIGEALGTITGSSALSDVRDVVHELLAEPAARGRADLVADLAFRLPLLVLNRSFGLDDSQGRRLVDLMRRVWDGGEEAEAAMVGLFGYAQTVTLERRAAPGQDIVSQMIRHPNGLDDEEVAHQLILIISAAHDPLMNLIANSLYAFLTDAEVHRAVMSGSMQVEELVDTVLWKAPPITLMPGRYPAQDTDLGDWRVREGDCLIMGYGPAHSDPAVLRHMDPFGMSGARAHLAFGTGPHQCPARNLARQIGVDSVNAVFRLLPDMTLEGPADHLRWRRSPFAHGLVSLPVTFTPTAAAHPTRRGEPDSTGDATCPHVPSPSSSPRETTGSWPGASVTAGRWRALWSRIWKSGP